MFQTNHKRVDLLAALLKQINNGLFYSVRSSAALEINATRGLFQLCLRLVQVTIIIKKRPLIGEYQGIRNNLTEIIQ